MQPTISSSVAFNSPITSMTLPNVENLLKLSVQNIGQLTRTLATKLPAQSPTGSALGITYSAAGGTTVSANVNGGYLMALYVTTPTTALSSQLGKIYDANSPSNVGASNLMALIPSSGQATYVYPYFKGLTVQPSSISTQVVSVYFI